MASSTASVIIVAGGSGSRAGGGSDLPKQYRRIGGRAILARTVEAFAASPLIDAVQVVIGTGHDLHYHALDLRHPKLLPVVTGGETRQESVLAGLNALVAHSPERVLIHDAARPFVSAALIGTVIDTLDTAPGALPVTLVTDTIKRSRDGKTVGGTEDRTQLYAAQTPQGFRFRDIFDAHRRAIVFSNSFTDDAAVAEWDDVPVALAQGDPRNIKITLPEDFARAERMIMGDGQMETRVGSGFDVHAFTAGDTVILGGIRIPHDAALKGHSDADVVLHALADAVYGALAEGDIGQHFPPSDPQWRGMASHVFLAHAIGRLTDRGGRLVHCDVNILCEAPKIAPHSHAMRKSIADIAGVTLDRVAVKAGTTEALGFLGRREGIAAQATATVELPRSTETTP